MSFRGFLALLLLASMALAPLSGTLAQETLEPALTESSPSEEHTTITAEPEQVQTEAEMPRTLTDGPGDVTAPVIIRAIALQYPHPDERSAGPRSEIEGRVTAISIVLSDEMNDAPEVRMDFSPLGGESSVAPYENISGRFDKHFYYEGPAITVPDGTYSLPFTASDPHGNTVTGTAPITIDETPPVIDSLSASYPAGRTQVASTDTITISGSFSDAASPAGTKVFDALLYEYDETGQPAASVPTSVAGVFVPNPYSLSTGAFSFEFPISTALINGSFRPNAKTFNIALLVRDGAGLIGTATSTRLAIGTSTVATTTGVSSVLFLPGIKGSRLYRPIDNCDPALALSCLSVKLWEPSGELPLRDLFLNATGVGARSDIYVKEGDILSEVLGNNFYASFVNQMNNLKVNGTPVAWKPVAYDWRLSLEDIVSKGVKRGDKIYFNEATETPYIEETLKALASGSPTKKVTIVAHSNGGLVAKKLMQRLEAEGLSKLVDKIVFVAVPQSGAPQAMAGLLYGYGEALPWDFCGQSFFLCDLLASRDVARELAEHSPMAYHLLPSEAYFGSLLGTKHPVAKFTAKNEYAAERTAYGASVDSASELYDFLEAKDGGRTKPAADDLKTPNVLGGDFIDYGERTHAGLDAWVPPAGITVYQIAGWGANTVAGVEFYDEPKFFGLLPGHKKMYRPLFIEDGDGVVPIPSALLMQEGTNVKRYWVNLHEVRKVYEKKFDHGNIFEIENLRHFLEDIFKDTGEPLPEFITEEQPRSIDDSKKLLFILHSPLTLGLYQGRNHTGMNENGTFDEEIPSDEYGEFGEVKYILAPAGQQYELKMQGLSSGEFSLDIQELTGNTVSSSATIANVPTTANTVATLTITNGISDASSLKVDGDGNGSIDIDISPEQGGTVLYSPSSSTEAEVLGSGSGHNSEVTSSSITDIEEVAPAEEILAVVSDNPLAAAEPEIKTSPNETETPENEVTPQEDVVQTQTASVYDAVGGKVVKWLGALLYNIWGSVLSFISDLFKS